MTPAGGNIQLIRNKTIVAKDGRKYYMMGCAMDSINQSFYFMEMTLAIYNSYLNVIIAL